MSRRKEDGCRDKEQGTKEEMGGYGYGLNCLDQLISKLLLLGRNATCWPRASGNTQSGDEITSGVKSQRQQFPERFWFDRKKTNEQSLYCRRRGKGNEIQTSSHCAGRTRRGTHCGIFHLQSAHCVAVKSILEDTFVVCFAR